MKTYIGVKIVQAEPQTKDGKEGYIVVYPDSYTSWCPKGVFEEANREVAGRGFPFSKALKALKQGKKVARQGWNKHNTCIYLQPGSTINGKRDGGNSVLKEMDHPVNIHPHIDLMTDVGVIVGWTPLQPDMLTDDWHIVE